MWFFCLHSEQTELTPKTFRPQMMNSVLMVTSQRMKGHAIDCSNLAKTLIMPKKIVTVEEEDIWQPDSSIRPLVELSNFNYRTNSLAIVK